LKTYYVVLGLHVVPPGLGNAEAFQASTSTEIDTGHKSPAARYVFAIGANS